MKRLTTFLALLVGVGLLAPSAHAGEQIDGGILYTRCEADEGMYSCVKTGSTGGTGIDESQHETTWEIFRAGDDGSAAQLTSNDVNEQTPVMSPSGRSMALSLAPDPESGMPCRAYVMPAGGGDMVPLVPTDDFACVTVEDWSPGGRWILLTESYDGDVPNLYKVRPDGSSLRSLTHFSEEGEGAWDGHWVNGAKTAVFNGTDSEGGARYVDGIYSVSSAGKHLKLLWKKPVWDLAVPPDRRSLYVASDSWRVPGEIFELDLHGGLVRQVTDNGVDEDALTFSPDGSKLLFGTGELYARPGPEPRPSARILDLDTGRTQPLRLPRYARLDIADFNWAWSPDGTKIAVRVRDRDYNFRILWTKVRKFGIGEVVSGAGLSVVGWLP